MYFSEKLINSLPLLLQYCMIDYNLTNELSTFYFRFKQLI